MYDKCKYICCSDIDFLTHFACANNFMIAMLCGGIYGMIYNDLCVSEYLLDYKDPRL